MSLTHPMGLQKEVIISKQDAVFWLDKKGRWCNQHGPFEHKKIIDHFHASIRKDEKGYFLSQGNTDYLEKVYFRYEDTALFVFDVIEQNGHIYLVCNTRRKFKLQPDKLFIKNDNLYIQEDDDLVKFSERALIQISKYIQDEGRQYFIRLGEEKYLIKEKNIS